MLKKSILPLLVLTGCMNWNNLPDAWTNYNSDALWDADLVAVDSGLYVNLPASKQVAFVNPDGDWSLVDLRGGQPTRIVGAPDGKSLLVFAQIPVCDSTERGIKTVEDCLDKGDDGDLRWESEVDIVRDGALIGDPTPMGSHFNSLAFTSDGSQAVAYLDYNNTDGLEFDGLLNATEVVFLDVATGATTTVPVGFAADRILFDQEDTKAVIFSESKVVVVELESGNYERLVTYSLSQDVDIQVHPQDAALTPDGRYALVTVQGSGDLYTLDLEAESINIVDLDASPSGMGVEETSDTTALVYASRAQVDVLDHEYFDVETLALDEPATDVQIGNGFAMLYNTGASNYHDIYRLDTEDLNLVEYRAKNPVVELHIAPDEGHAVAVTRPEPVSGSGLEALTDNNWGMEILSLTSDKGQSINLISQSQPVGVAFSADSAYALVLLEGVDDLLKLDLYAGTTTELPLEDSPLGIGAFGDGGFYITHDAALGLVSFYNPDTDDITAVGQFAIGGLLADETELPRTEEE
jgi:DNA-binding beta-propeller fold protein YncE